MGIVSEAVVERFGAKPVIASSAALMGIAFLLSATVTAVWEFFSYYGVLAAIGFAGCSSTANPVLVSKWYVRDRPKMLGWSSMGINIGQLLFLPVAGYVIAVAGFRAAFVVLGLFMLVLVVPAVVLVVKDDPETIGQVPDGCSPRPAFSSAGSFERRPEATISPSGVVQHFSSAGHC